LKGEKLSTSMRPKASCVMRGDFGAYIRVRETKRESQVILT
jgi:hypothetical protein